MSHPLPLSHEAYWCRWCGGFDHGGTIARCVWSGYLIWRTYRYANFSRSKWVRVP